ncbi:hypothetical protein L4C31_22765, partial [Aliivibrio sifiae]
ILQLDTIEYDSTQNLTTMSSRMSDRDKKTLRTLLSGSEWNHIQWYQAVKSKTKYALDFERI